MPGALDSFLSSSWEKKKNMTKGLIAVDLIFPPVVHFFGPRPCDKYSTYPRRQKVRGKLRIVTSKAIKFQHVEIRLKGHTEVCWRDPLRSQSSILAEKLYAYKTLRKSKSTLLDDATLPAGVTELGKRNKKKSRIGLYNRYTEKERGDQDLRCHFQAICVLRTSRTSARYDICSWPD